MASERRFELWLALAIGIGAILSSWAIVPIPTLGFELPKLLPLALSGLLCALLLLFEGRSGLVQELSRAWPGRFALLFFFVCFLSLAWSAAPVLSIVGAAPRYEGVLTYGIYAVLFLSACRVMGSKKGRKVLIGCLIIANAGVVIYALMQILGLDPLSIFWDPDLFLGRTFSLLGQPNALGLFLVLTIPFVLQSAKRMEKKQWQTALAVLLIANIVVLLSSVSRSAIFGLAAAVALGFFWKFPQLKRIPRRKWIMLLVATIVLVLTADFFMQIRFATPSEAGRSTSARYQIWEGAVRMIKARPLGYGLETTGILSARFIDRDILRFESLTTRIDRAHSQPIDILITLGPLGLLTFYGFLLTALFTLWKQRKQSSLDGLASSMALLGGSVTLLAGFHMVATAAVFWIIAGIALGGLITHEKRPLSTSTICANKVPLLFLAATTFLLTLNTLQWISARVEMERGEQWLAAENLQESVQAFAASAQRFPYDRQLLAIASETSLLALERADSEKTKETLTSLVESHLDQLDHVTNEQDGLGMLLRAWLAAIQKDANGVDWFLTLAAIRQPDSVTNYRIAAHAFALLGNDDRKRETYRALVSILPEGWDDPSSDYGRILWKEHPWLEEVRSESVRH